MEIYFYAQLNDDNICFCVTQLTDTVESNDKMVPLSFYDESVLNKHWDGKEWHEVPKPEPETEPEAEDETMLEEELDIEDVSTTEDEPVENEEYNN